MRPAEPVPPLAETEPARKSRAPVFILIGAAALVLVLALAAAAFFFVLPQLDLPFKW